MSFTTSAVQALVAALALASIANAAPTMNSDQPLRLSEASFQRRDIQSPIQGLPGCAISHQGQSDNQDPTWAVGKSNYTDGQGKYIGSDCDNHQKGGSHCWTDYFLVGTTEAYNDWYSAVGDIQCSGSGSTCTQSISQTIQKCTTTDWSASVTVSTDIDLEIFKAGFSITETTGKSWQSCNGNTTVETCSWTDSNCHSVWAAQRVTMVHGYTRRRCNSPASGPGINMPNSPADGDAYSRGMMDFAIPLADGTAINCNGTCESSYNPGAAPAVPGGPALKPWPA